MPSTRPWPPHGQLGFLELPATDIARSAEFYRTIFGWSVEPGRARFQAPGMAGHWTTDRSPAGTAGPLLWICVDQLWPTLDTVAAHGGRVHQPPRLDHGERWLVEIDDPAGNRIGLTARARTAQAQPMIAVRDVEAASRWYQELLGLTSDHGGAEYERLLSDGILVLQLHQREVAHHHGPIAPTDGETGLGVLLWFGEVARFDDVVQRVERLHAPVVRAPHRNPPEGEGNGPGHREIWLQDLDGYTVVIASPDGEAYEPV